jgi:hypothetical protein
MRRVVSAENTLSSIHWQVRTRKDEPEMRCNVIFHNFPQTRDKSSMINKLALFLPPKPDPHLLGMYLVVMVGGIWVTLEVEFVDYISVSWS